jgi:hypothetical protein
MITSHLMGGLGNQLFQIFCGLSTALRTNTQFIVLSKYLKNFNGREDRPTYWDTIFSCLCRHLKFSTTYPDVYYLKEPVFYYMPIPVAPIVAGRNVMLSGYYQSEKYFKDKFDIIYDMFEFDRLRSMLMDSKLNNPSMEATISMHFRMGDYKKLQHIHPIMTHTYYRNAMEYILNLSTHEQHKAYYFCEEEDISIVMAIVDKLREEFGEKVTFIRADPSLADWEQMLFMSSCENHIIANSSFSWWGAYLNRNPNKMVCYPSRWFGTHSKHNTMDLCPLEWIRIAA